MCAVSVCPSVCQISNSAHHGSYWAGTNLSQRRRINGEFLDSLGHTIVFHYEGLQSNCLRLPIFHLFQRRERRAGGVVFDLSPLYLGPFILIVHPSISSRSGEIWRSFLVELGICARKMGVSVFLLSSSFRGFGLPISQLCIEVRLSNQESLQCT